MRTRQIPPGIAQTLMDAGHDQARSGSEASKVALTGGEPFAVRIRLIDPGDTDPRGHQNLVIARFEAQSTKLQEPTLSIPDVCSRIGGPNEHCGYASANTLAWGRSNSCCSDECFWRVKR